MRRKLVVTGIVAGAVVFGFLVWRLGGPELGIVGIITGVSGWLLGRHKARGAKDRTARANAISVDEVSAAGDAAAARVADVDRDANAEVESAGDLVDMLIDRDPGPDDNG